MKARVFFLILSMAVFSFAQEEIRIACIGNSITAYFGGYPSLDLDSYPAQLRILMGPGYNIQNYGVSGRTLLKKGDFPIWKEPAFSAALAFKPHIVTIMLGTNDSKPQNWVYKDEFISDYIAMIDTFRALETHPEIYVCIPPPAFSRKYDINDSVITYEMIPMLEQIIQQKNTHFIDFHTFFQGKGYLFYDGIHPTLDGLWEFAKEFYYHLHPNPKPIVELKDVNLALHQPVRIGTTLYANHPMNDGNLETEWSFGDGGSAVMDLGGVHSSNMIQMVFKESGKFGYRIEKSLDQVQWDVLVDKWEPQTEIQSAIVSFDSVEFQSLRFTFHSADSAHASIPVAEIKVLQTAPSHAPLLTYRFTRFTSRQAYFDLTMTGPYPGGALKYYFYDIADTVRTDGIGIGYRGTSELTRPFNVLKGREKYFYAKFYYNGYEVTSDTVKIVYPETQGIDTQSSLRPSRFQLYPIYPNPFNATAVIRYDLNTSGHVRLTVYDNLGRTVKTLVDEVQKPGQYSLQFNATSLPSGIYLCQLDVQGMKKTTRMVVLK